MNTNEREDQPKDLVVWKDSFSVGVKKIDDQHRALIRITNSLYMDSFDRTKTKEAFVKALKGLFNYTKAHFKTEEDMFEKTNYPEITEHKKQHYELLLGVVDKAKRLDSGNQSQCRGLIKFLVDWILNHVAIHDRAFGDFCSELQKSGKLIIIE